VDKNKDTVMKLPIKKIHSEIVNEARMAFGSDEINIDDNAKLSVAEDAVWVQAWVRVPCPENVPEATISIASVKNMIKENRSNAISTLIDMLSDEDLSGVMCEVTGATRGDLERVWNNIDFDTDFFYDGFTVCAERSDLMLLTNIVLSFDDLGGL